jgi:cytochrome c oxidase subunit 5a
MRVQHSGYYAYVNSSVRVIQHPWLVGARTSRPGVFRREKKPHRKCRRTRPNNLFLLSSSLLPLATPLHPLSFHPPTHPVMRTQLISTLLRARPTTVSRIVTTTTTTTPRLLARPSSNAAHHQETFESFTERYVTFFQSAEDLFEVQRGLNNCFAHDLVPAPVVVESALRASRRVNDYATAVRILEGIKEKVENKTQYQAYMDELKPVREELGAFLSSCHESPYTPGHLTFFGLPSRHRHKRRTVLFVDPHISLL